MASIPASFSRTRWRSIKFSSAEVTIASGPCSSNSRSSSLAVISPTLATSALRGDGSARLFQGQCYKGDREGGDRGAKPIAQLGAKRFGHAGRVIFRKRGKGKRFRRTRPRQYRISGNGPANRRPSWRSAKPNRGRNRGAKLSADPTCRLRSAPGPPAPGHSSGRPARRPRPRASGSKPVTI